MANKKKLNKVKSGNNSIDTIIANRLLKNSLYGNCSFGFEKYIKFKTK